MKIQGPVEVEVKVGITDGDGTSGTATLGLGKGRYPTEQNLRDAVAKFEREDMPDGFRLMTKREWWDSVCPPDRYEDEDGELVVEHFAIPGGEEWDQ